MPDRDTTPIKDATATPALDLASRDCRGTLPRDRRSWELTRALLGESQPDMSLLCRAAEAAARWLFEQELDARRAQTEVLEPTLDRLDASAAEPSHGLLLIAADCAERLGDPQSLDQAVQKLERNSAPGYERGSAFLRIAARSCRTGNLDAALEAYGSAAVEFSNAGIIRDAAIAQGGIADILEARGQLDAALLIRLEQQLPVYERLGDEREKTVTLGKIADILQDRGRLDEALRIRVEEQIPVFERLGDIREKAVTLGRIADILQDRGKLDEALQIRIDNEMPVYEQLGDVREKAITRGRIADILQERGQLDEALRILNDEVLTVFERLGDLHSIVVCRTNIAITLLLRNAQDGNPHDASAANTLLCEALADARRLRLPEARQIEEILARTGLSCED